MSAKLLIQDGNPNWLSPSIIPSRDTVVSPSSSPSLATIQTMSNDVFVYVKVENTGDVDLGGCTCTRPVVEQWKPPTPFLESTIPTQGKDVTFSALVFHLKGYPARDFLAFRKGATVFEVDKPVDGLRAWATSVDPRFFAYVYSITSSGRDWSLIIFAVEDIIRSDGSKILQGQVAATASGSFSGPWTKDNFCWAGDKAVMIGGDTPGSGYVVSIVCPEAPSPNVLRTQFPVSLPVDFHNSFLVSPCKSVVAYAPKQAGQDFFLVSTDSAKQIPFRQSNVPLPSIKSTGVNVSIETTGHGANGVRVHVGSGTSTVMVDDPECTFVGGGIKVEVDRIRASTLLTQQLGVLHLGFAVIGKLHVGNSAWAQIPKQNSWQTQSDPHWCIVAQAYTADPGTVPRPWDGQPTHPFPIADENCSQRNIEIT